MAKDRRKLQHIHSSIPDRQPTPQTLEVGEIAVNNADKQEFLSIKSSNDKVVRFSSDEQMITWMEKKGVMPYKGYVKGRTANSTYGEDPGSGDTYNSYGITNQDLLENKSQIVIKLNQVAAPNTAKYDKVNAAKDKYGNTINPWSGETKGDGAGFYIDMSRYAMNGANPSFSSLTVTDKTDLSGNTTIANGDGTGTRTGHTLTIKTTDVISTNTNWDETITNHTSKVTSEKESATTRTTVVGTENLTVSGTTTEQHTGDVTITNKANVTETTDGTLTEKIKTNNYRDVDGNYSGTTGGTTTEVKTGAVNETNSSTTTIDRVGDVSVNNRANVTEVTSGNSNVTISGTSKVQVSGATTADTKGNVTVTTSGTTSIDRQGAVTENNQNNVTLTTSGTTSETKKGAVTETNLADKTETTVGNNYENVSGATVINHVGTTSYNHTGATTFNGSSLVSTTTGNTTIEANGNDSDVTIQSTGTSGDVNIYAKDVLTATGNTIVVNGAASISAKTPTTYISGTTLEAKETNINLSAATGTNISGGTFTSTSTGNTTLNASGNTAINTNGNTTVTTTGNTTIQSTASGSNVNIYAGSAGTVSVSGKTVSITGTTGIKGNTTVDGVITAKSGLTVNTSGANITGNTNVVGSISATSNGNIGGNLNVTGNTNITGTTNISGTTTIDDNLNVTGNAKITGTTDISGKTTIDDDLAVTGKANITGATTIGGAATINNNLTVTGNTNTSGNTNIAGNLKVTGTTDISGATVIDDTLTTNGKLTVTTGGASITGNSDVNGTFTAKSGLTVNSGGASVTGATNLNGNTKITGTVTTSSDANIGGNLNVTGNAKITGTTDISGKTTIDDSLDVTNNLTISGNSTFKGNVTFENPITFTPSCDGISSTTINDAVCEALSRGVVTMQKSTPAASSEILATYKLFQNGSQIGEDINIPKDHLLKDVSIVYGKYNGTTFNTCTSTATDCHWYIKLVWNVFDPETGHADYKITYLLADDFIKDINDSNPSGVSADSYNNIAVNVWYDGKQNLVSATTTPTIHVSQNLYADATVSGTTVKGSNGQFTNLSAGATTLSGKTTINNDLDVNGKLKVTGATTLAATTASSLSAASANITNITAASISADDITISGDLHLNKKLSFGTGTTNVPSSPFDGSANLTLTVPSDAAHISRRSLSWSYGSVTSASGSNYEPGQTSNGSFVIPNNLTHLNGVDDLKAIEALTGTSGLLKKTAANTWTLDTTSYSSATQVRDALSGKSNTGHTHDDRYYTESEIDTKLSGKSDTGHTHDDRYYTKSELTGGSTTVVVAKAASATTAASAGSVALSNVSGADDIKAIEALTGTSGLLKKTAANTWSLDTTSYSSATQVSTALSGKSDTGHTHDDRYYTESEIDTKLSGKSDTSHNHDSVYVNITGDTMSGALTAPKFYMSSDINLKENIASVDYSKIANANGVAIKEFNFKNDESKKIVYGVIAQEVEAAGLEEVVVTNDNGYKAVDYTSLSLLKIAYLENKIKELEAMITKLTKK